MSESKCLCLSELIVFQPIKNKMPFLPLQQIYEEIFFEKYPKQRYLSFLTAVHYAGTKRHYVSHTITTSFFVQCHVEDNSDYQFISWISFQNGNTIIQTQFGAPVPDVTASLTAGRRGSMLLQDVGFLEIMANFDRERIPERFVHAKGAGGDWCM